MSIEYPVEIIKEKVDKEYLNRFINNPFKEVVKFVVDIEREIIALGGEFHIEAEEFLIKDGSQVKNLWGANFYLNKPKQERIEFFSLINIRPVKNNRSMEIQDREIKEKIKKIVDKLIP